MAIKESVNRAYESALSEGIGFERGSSTRSSPATTRKKA